MVAPLLGPTLGLMALTLATAAVEAPRRYLLQVAEGAQRHPVGHAEVWPQGREEPAAVVLRDGQPVGTWGLNVRTGDPVEVLFDARGAGRFELLVGSEVPEPPLWEPQAGVVLETRGWGGGNLNTVDGILQLWADSGPRHGRGLVEQIFHGYNPYGPSGRFTSRYQAWLRIREPGTYRFGTISDDASALWIDEQPVADWPGGHNVWQRGGHRFRHNGSIELAAGLHRLEYLHVQAGSATACVAAWLPPGAEKPVPIPAEAFAPVTPYRADGLGDGPLVAWRAVRHNAWRDHLLVTMELTVTGIGEDTEVRWRSDDGATHRGHRWRHVFLRPGLRLVTLTLEPPGGGTTTIEQAVRVGHAHFQRHQFDDEHFRTQREAVMGRDFAGLDGADRAELVTLALRSRDRDWLAAIAERLAAVDGLGGVEAAAVLDLAIAVQHPELQRYETAIALFEGLRDGQQVPPGVRAAAALHQAGLLIQILGRPAEGRELLEALDHEALSGGDRRLARIYRADADLYAGRSDAALRRYRQVGTTTHDGDLGYAVTRRIRLEMARDYIRRGAADAAEEILRSIEWETPEERMGGELVELQAEVWLLRGEWRFALARLPAVIAARREDPRLPELLLLHLRALLAADRREDAEAVAAELRRDYPLSEASARIAHHLQSAAETAE